MNTRKKAGKWIGLVLGLAAALTAASRTGVAAVGDGTDGDVAAQADVPTAGASETPAGGDPAAVPFSEPIGYQELIGCDTAPGLLCDGSPGCDGACDTGCDKGCAWLSCKDHLAAGGITFIGNLTQFYFGTVSGGIDETTRYAGHGDYLALCDLSRWGLHEGLTLTLRAEHRFGTSINRSTGALLPENLAADLPTARDRDLYLTNFLFTQSLTDNFQIFAGKLDTLNGDMNAFAHGRGIKQFSHVAFNGNPALFRTVPYATLGAGFAYLYQGQPLLTFSILNPVDTATSSGFDELFAEGVVLTGEMRVPTNYFGRPGHQLVGFSYSNREYASLDQDPRIVLPNVPIDRTSGSWAVYWNSDHYLCVDRCDPNRGWGYFTRAAVADDESNLVGTFWSMGLGGSSPLRSRPADSFGVGYYQSETSNEIAPFISSVFGGLGDGEGIEAFYNIQVGKMLTVTPDFQWISSARQSIDDAYLLGVRANLVF